MFSFFKKKNIECLNVKMPRDELVRRSRILIIDDERPDIIEDLQAAHFSVDYVTDITSNDFDKIDKLLYDLILLDFGNVGLTFGQDQGLSLLKHIKRVNPAIVVFSYTSKALKTKHADFYRLADGTLAKDAGIQESLEKIEDGLRKAHSIENIWMGLLSVCDVKPGSSEDIKWQDLLVKGHSSKRKINTLTDQIKAMLTSEPSKTVALSLLGKATELAVMAYIGAK